MAVVSSLLSASGSSRARALDDREQTPGLVPRQRPARRDRHRVALARLVVLIVCQQLGGAAHEFAVGRMAHDALDRHRDGLVHLVAHDLSGQRAHGLAGVGGLRAHFLPPAYSARCTVFTRAMFLRTLPNWSGLTACPVARCKRSANCSLRSDMSSFC